MCAIIFAAKELEYGWVQGLDVFADWVGEEDDLKLNTGGEGKRYPQGPVCEFKGKILPTMCCCSESGCITADLLVAMLKVFDKSEVFLDRTDGIAPFLLLDGHGSRFDLTFLEYPNNPASPWSVCIGVPYGTSYWQVGDSSQQNGSFKMNIGKAKKHILTKKSKADLP
jgi:hypothetical protein